METPSWHLSNPKPNTKVQFIFFKNLDLKKRIVFIVALVIVLAGSGFGVFYLARNFEARASLDNVGETTPYNVKFTQVTSSGFSIEWNTKDPTIGFIKYGTTGIVLDLIGQEKDKPGDYKTNHKITVDGLDSGTKYYVEVHSNAQAFGSDGYPLSIETLD